MRLKVIAGNLAVVVLLGLFAYVFVGGQLRTELLANIDGRIASDRQLFDRSLRLSALEFQALVEERAGERSMRDVFGGLDQDSRRTRGYEAAEATAAWLADPARGQRGAPDIAVIVDEAGTALARNGARNVLYGKLLTSELPALAQALRSGQPAHDIWQESQEKKLLETAIAPIRADSGTVLGALVVGYDLSNGVAKREAALLGRDVAFITEGSLYSSSLDSAAARSDLQSKLLKSDAEATKRILAGGGGVSPVWMSTLGGSDFIGVTARVPLAPSVPVAYAVLGNRSKQLEIAGVVGVILILTVLGAVLVVLYGFVMGNFIMRPIEAIEEGVLAVINGRTDLRLETTSAELGGLAFRINQLLNVMTGTEETTSDSEGRVSIAPSANTWKDAAFSDGAAGGGAANPDEPIDDEALSARLAAEEASAYESRVYAEYVAAKQALGENVANIPQDRFHQRLAGRATALTQKHGCRMVRFQVETVANQVVLRPVLIR
jgi:hypothetical protein